MPADNDSVLEAARSWAGARMALATVVSTWGSAPRPKGSHMIVHADGRFEGSVSGGCVESDVLAIAADVIAGAPAVLKSYGVADAQAWEVGLPCGGSIEVLVQPVSDAGFPPELFARIEAARLQGLALEIATDLATGRSGAGSFINCYEPPRRLLIVGAVQIAQSLSRLATELGFSVTIIDPRARFLTSERFPGMTLDDRWPDEAVTALRPDPATAVVVLSHDPKIDDPALTAALAHPTAYVAALGSRKSHAARLERLGAAGINQAQLLRIDGPAGIPIGAVGASEIALSVAAGMVRAFHAER